MSEIVDIVPVRSEYEDEHDDHDGDEDQLAFKKPADQIEAFPVKDDIANNGANDPVEWSGGTCFDDGFTGIGETAEDVAPDSGN